MLMLLWAGESLSARKLKGQEAVLSFQPLYLAPRFPSAPQRTHGCSLKNSHSQGNVFLFKLSPATRGTAAHGSHNSHKLAMRKYTSNYTCHASTQCGKLIYTRLVQGTNRDTVTLYAHWPVPSLPAENVGASLFASCWLSNICEMPPGKQTETSLLWATFQPRGFPTRGRVVSHALGLLCVGGRTARVFRAKPAS